MNERTDSTGCSRLVGIVILAGWIWIALTGSVSAEPDTSDAAIREAVDVVFVLDNSGSMKENDPEFLARAAVRNFARALADDPTIDGRVGVVLFDGRARLVRSLSSLAAAGSDAPLREALAELDFSGQRTNSPAGIERALYEFRQNGREDARRAIVLLTDGKIDTGDDRGDAEAARWLREDLANESLASGIHIFGVAFTDAADYQLMQALAQRTQARYYRAFEAAELTGVVDDVLERVTGEADDPARVAEAPTDAAPAATDESLADVAAAGPVETRGPDARLLGLLPFAAVFVGGALLWHVRRRRRDSPVAATERRRDAPLAQLLDLDGRLGRRGVAIELGSGRTRIGRDAHNELVLEADAISSEHAVIDYRDGCYWIEDLRSTNGTSLGSQLLTPGQRVQLKGGDHIRLADIDLMFVLAGYVPGGATVFLNPTTTPPKDPHEQPADTGGSEDSERSPVDVAGSATRSGQLSLLRTPNEAEALVAEDAERRPDDPTSIAADLERERPPSIDPALAEIRAIRANLDDHVGRVAELSAAFAAFIARAFDEEIRDAISVSARDLVSQARDGQCVVRKNYTFDHIRFVLCGVPGGVEHARDLFVETFGGFTRLLSEELHAESFRAERCEILAVLTFGFDAAPWVSLSIVPDEGRDPRIDLLSYEFLTDEEREEIEVNEQTDLSQSGLG